MRSLIAFATYDSVHVWDEHFGTAPVYIIFNEKGEFIKKITNPYVQSKEHDNPKLIVDLLNNVSVFMGKKIGEKSKEELINMNIYPVLTENNDINSALKIYLHKVGKFKVFDKLYKQYEQWFEDNKAVYESEINMLKVIMPGGSGIEVGVGSGRFAYPLGIKFGLEPSLKMAQIAKKKGIKIYLGFAENMPIKSNSFDFALIAVTICFVDDPIKTIRETKRILKENGKIVIAIVDKNSKIGNMYLEKQMKSGFYRVANFYSTEEVISMLRNNGFNIIDIKQTLFGDDIKSIRSLDSFKDGYGAGAFVAILGKAV